MRDDFINKQTANHIRTINIKFNTNNSQVDGDPPMLFPKPVGSQSFPSNINALYL